MALWSFPGKEGERAEILAEKYLRQRGLKPRTRNYRCKAGEIDLIMAEGETLVFVEVRLRRNARFAGAAESVDGRKQQKLIRAAQHYLLRHGLTDQVVCRFDIIAFDRGLNPQGITWLQNAFGTS